VEGVTPKSTAKYRLAEVRGPQRRLNTGDLKDHRKFDSHTLPPT